MSVIRLEIDIKSLYFNIKNDNDRGHTATVATPLKQGASVRPELAAMMRIPENIDPYCKENLTSQILLKSRAMAKINRICLFDRISVNGFLLEELPSFCMYIREETDPKNFHCGRQKLHYPMSLEYSDETIEINNRTVLKAISKHLHEYAFLVEAFEYDTDTGILNFDTLIVGESGMPYSKIFINRRGVGNKFTPHFTEGSDVYDSEIIALREKMGYDAVSPVNFNDILLENQTSALNLAIKYLNDKGVLSYRILTEEYPYSLYDIEYSLNGKKNYLIIKQTATKVKYFSLPLTKIQFCNDFSDATRLLLVTDIKGMPKINVYTINDMNKMNKSINSITYEDRS